VPNLPAHVLTDVFSKIDLEPHVEELALLLESAYQKHRGCQTTVRTGTLHGTYFLEATQGDDVKVYVVETCIHHGKYLYLRLR